MLGNIVICQLITTGKDPLKDEIIETGLVRINNQEIIEATHFHSKPSRKLPIQVKSLTGLNDDFYIDKPHFDKLVPDIFNFIGDAILVSYDANLVYTFLSAAVGHPLPTLCIDTFQLSKIVLPTMNNHRLSTLYEKLFTSKIKSHGAYEMALATADVFLKLCATFQELDPNHLTQLNNILNQSSESTLATFIKSLTTRVIKNFSFNKISVNNFGHSFNDSIHEDNQSLFYEYIEESARDHPTPIYQKQVIEILGPGGKLAQIHPHYEHRPEQLTMAAAVTEALNNKSILLTEAGTGTGKSMAYLIPSVLWAVHNNKKVVVSTHTINLQEQLWFKDIPFLKQILDIPFRAALIKGRQNYLCFRRWSEILSITNILHAQEALFFSRILFWLNETKTGDRSELNLSGVEYNWWTKICAESDSCNGPNCKWFHRKCFVTKAKKLAEKSNLIIINHSLLCSDLQTESRILPSYGPLIIDEAHHLENVATDHFGYMASEIAIKQWLNATEKLLQKLTQTTTGTEDGNWYQIIYTTRKIREDIARNTETLFELLKSIFYTQNALEKNNSGVDIKRLYKGFYQNEDDLAIKKDNLLLSFKTLITSLKKILLRVEAWATQYERWIKINRNLSLHLNLGIQLLTNINFILSNQNESFVYWMEAFHLPNNTNITLKAVPIDIGQILYEKLFNHKKSVILTSATLTIEGNFEYFKARTGLNLYDEEIIELQIDSPFNYTKQAQLYITCDLPNQSEVPDQFYHNTLANIIEELVSATKGRSLVLFTSHRTLKEIYMRLKPLLEEIDILLLGHNIDGSPSSLVDEFQSNQKSVLFGTASFWEGVDIPGESLSSVIIVKLPFWSPKVPIIEARLEYLDKQGKSGFWEFSLPQAVIRFKQGFGRLIRSSRDHGVVIILDKRIMQKKYGRYFLNSLPLKYHLRGNLNNLLPKINKWLKLHKNKSFG